MLADVSIYAGIALAGLLSFLSPCVLPLVPPYLSYVGGATIDQLSNNARTRDAYWRVMRGALFFVLGFTTVFVLLGAGVSVFGQSLLAYKDTLSVIAGIVIIGFGLHFLGLLRIPVLFREARFNLASEPAGLAGSYLLGLAFAFGWTPCIGPILSAVLTVVAGQADPAAGVGMLLAYSLGLGVPFLLAAAAIRPFLSFSNRFKRYLGLVEKAMGLLLILAGVLFLTGGINDLGNWLLERFPELGVIEESLTSDGLREEILRKATQGDRGTQ